MSILSTNKRMIKLYYNSETSTGKQTLGYIDDSEKDQLAVDIQKTNVTGTQWKEIAENLGKPIGALIDQAHPSFTEMYNEQTELDETDWIKVLNKHPEVLAYPILIVGEKFYQIENPSDVEKLLDNSSKGIDEKKYI